jgi:hypothetical protein
MLSFQFPSRLVTEARASRNFAARRDAFGDLALYLKDVSQLSVVGFAPNVGICLRVNQLNSDPHPIGHFLDTTLKDVSNAKLFCDLSEVARFVLILLRGSARNHF